MTPPRTIGLSGFGGMGDMFKWYCLQSALRGWGYLQPLKEKYPSVRTMALVCSTNPHAVDLFAHNPYIDVVEYYAWPINNKGNLLQPGQLHLERILSKKGYPLMNIPSMQKLGLKPKECIIHLDEADNKELENIIKEAGRYIVVHPFASVIERQVVDPKRYSQLIDRLVQEFDCNVVILGKSYQRSFSSQKGLTSYSKEETIQVANSRVFNLVDKTNTRVAIKITQKAIGFVGVLSCFSAISITTRVPAAVLCSSGNHQIAQREIQRLWAREPNFNVISVDLQSWNETIDQSCSHLQKYL
jgi:ADP-heptose:LPS heptosyltransferase